MILLPKGYRDPDPVDVNAPATHWLTYLIFATSLAIYYLLPILAGIFTETFGFGSRQTGMLLSADMTANTIAAFSARYWIHRCFWRRVFPVAVLLTVIPNLLCGMAESFETFLAYRYMAGLGAGTMVAFMYATIRASVNPDREFAYAMALQVFVGALCLNGATWLWMTWGAAPVFIMTGLVALLPMICYHAIPRSNPLTGNTCSDKQLSKPSAVTDRTVVLLPFLQGIGIAAGPVLAGLVIVDNQYANVIYISLFLLSFSYMLFAGMYRQSRIRRADPGAGKLR